MPAPPTERDIKASGVRLRVMDAGSGPPLLLLHGMFVDHRTWDSVSQELSDQFRVVSVDLPGFGESEKPPDSRFPYTIEGMGEAIADLYAGLGLGRAALVGHGLGGAVAAAVASTHPELVSHLVLVNSMSYPAEFDIRRRAAMMPLLGSFVFKQLLGRNAFRSYFNNFMLSERGAIAQSRIDDYYYTFSEPAARASAFATLRATADTRALIAHIARVSSPTLVVWGRHDRVYPAAHGQMLARQLPGQSFHLLDSGHLPQEERPTAVADLIGSFVRDQRASG